MFRNAIATAMLVGIVLVSRAQAQVVRGAVTSGAGGQPIQGAAVSLMDSSGARIGGLFSDAAGDFSISAPAPGRYIVRAVRIGYRPAQSAPLVIGAGQVVEQQLVMDPVPVALPAVVTRGDDRCVIRPDEGLAVARVWQAARAGLDAALLLQEQGLVRTTVVRFERSVRLNGKTTSERSWTLSGQGANPFQSAPPERLAEYGYSRTYGDSTTYFAPDARALLSDEFSDHHCFRLQAANDSNPKLVGLAFEPSKLGKKLDIEGVIWLDRESSELRHLDFHYTMKRSDPLDERLGGRIDFEQLTNGATIVKRWVIRMPIRVANQMRRQGPLFPDQPATLVAIREAGGEVTEILSAAGRSLSRSSIASLTGTVHDSIQGGAAAGVSVFLAGTMFSSTTDTNGRYRFDSLPPGRYTLSFDAPTLDSLGIAAPYATVELRAGTTTEANLAVPSVSVLLAVLCPGPLPGTERGMVAGVVRDAASAKPLANAEVGLSWRGREVVMDGPHFVTDTIRVKADSLGGYRVCRAPAGEIVRAKAYAGKYGSGSIDIAIPESGIAVRDLRVDVAAAGKGEHDAARLAGAVTTADGAPIAGVRVGIDGVERIAVTDSLGHFLLSDLPAGSQTVEFRRVGFAPLRQSTELRRGEVTRADATLAQRVVTIDSVQVVGRPANSDPTGFLRRRQQIAGGHFFDHREIDSLATFKLSDVLRMTPALIVSAGGHVNVRRNVNNNLHGCSIQFYVDGAPYDGTLDDFRPDDIESMEVYPDGTSVPARFGGARAGCGVIVLWTRIVHQSSGKGTPR
ncbi:MAG TPA: carboxypeptidase regulatory-like domain-containing protein [Gemmatimonadaceae bacterium]|nr:carboxypeptidase regulatory-like domain-containing protein [Gemmatimonadaceae bacterium]